MAVPPNSENNLRLCQLTVWQNYPGLGFNLEASSKPPHFIRLVESNSPAAAGGLKMLDVILAINQQDVSEAKYETVKNAIISARDSGGPIELLVMEQRFYQQAKRQNLPIKRSSPLVIRAPPTMPASYLNFQKNQPRTCTIRLSDSEPTFGFEVVNGEGDIGAYIQEVFPNTPASRTELRKSDRIIEIDDKFVDKDVSKSILEKLNKCKSKRVVKLYVMDTETYKNHIENNRNLQSKHSRRSQSEESLKTGSRTFGNDPPYQNDRNTVDNSVPSASSTMRSNGKARTPSVPDLTRTTSPPAMVTPISTLQNEIPVQEDIRLCTIIRADPEDSVGIELSYHRLQHFHSLTVIPGRDNGPSNASLAGVRTGDRLIEINGENVQSLDHDQVTDIIRGVKYSQPLKMLVSDVTTYEYYRQKNQKINRNLPSVKILPPNTAARGSPSPTSRRSVDMTETRDPLTNPSMQTINYRPNPSPSSRTDPTSITNSASDFQPRQIPIKKDSANGVGFNFRTTQNDPRTSSTPYSHIITSVDNANSIVTQGLRVNDHIISVNEELVEYLNHDQLEEKLRRAPNTETMRLLVADGAVYRAYKQSNSSGSRYPDTPVKNSPLNDDARRHVLRLRPNFEGYGFRVSSNYGEGMPHYISSVEPNSPADHQGLRRGDYILRVNNQNVEHMNSLDFNNFMQAMIANEQSRDGSLILEVMDPKTYQQNRLSSSPYRTLTPTNNLSASLDNDEPYPTMRHCCIKLWPAYQDLGFSIANSPSGGYVIQQLRLDSPAAHTHVRNGDHLIQVNNINVETTDFQYVQDLLQDSVRRDGTVSLLLIDGAGYQWYKRNHFRIDPLSQRANVSRYVTPEQQTVYISRDSTVIAPFSEQLSDHREIQMPAIPYHPTSTMQSRPPSTGPTTSRSYPYPNGYGQTPRDQTYRSNISPSVTSSLSRQRPSLTRAAVDVVDGKSISRVCRLSAEPGQNFGFELSQDDGKHVIRNVKIDSPAARSGLHNDDRLIAVNEEDVTNRNHRDVVTLIKTMGSGGILRLTVAPSTARPANKPIKSSHTKSLPSLNDDRIYQGETNPEFTSNGWSPYEAPVPIGRTASPMIKYMSTSRIDNTGISNSPYTDRPYSALGYETYRQQAQRPTFLTTQPYLPTDPWPRKCVLVRDPAFQGCGFRMIEKEHYDTPIVVEVRPNSPAKRSGLTEGDHIIYIDNRNVQAIRTFDQMTRLIQEIFEETGQVTLVTLTTTAYQVLKRKGGYLQPEPFDYQLPFVRELSPRLCRIVLHNHEQEFGFTLQRGNPIHIKDVHPGSPSYEHGLRMNDKILEINGRDTVSLSSDQIIEIVETSKRRRQLEILVIDTAGYEFSVKHGIPLNSLLPFVQVTQRRASSTRRNQQEPVYL